MEERVFFDEMIEESDDTEEFQGMYQDEIEQEAVNYEDLGEQEFQAMFDGNDFSHEMDELYRIEDIENIAMVDFLNICAHEMEYFHFPNLQIAFDFYNHYVKSVGFGARKSLHSIITKYVKSQYNLVDFIKHFKRCLTYLRYKEVEADYVSIFGLPVLKTTLEPLKRSATNFYTREIFFIFQPMLVRAARMKVVQDVAFDSFVLYTIAKYGSLNSSWEVSVDNEMMKFNCLCLRMDFFGIPCEHIVYVLVFLNILELPKSLVLIRWSKNANTSTFDSNGITWESIILSQYGCLMDWCRQLSYVASRRHDRFQVVRDTIMSLIEDFKIEDEQEKQVGAEAHDSDGIFSKNPRNCKSKCRPGEKVKRKPQRCSICRMEGNNKKFYPLAKDIQQTNGFWASDLEEDYEEQEFWAGGGSDASADMELSEEFSL
ncbi:Protein FAR1-RELATED SEQUENCE [Arachis hypogaea]|nr:Protein FAR1-RELATED SEQUENCE [Arachis hypogaea]